MVEKKYEVVIVTVSDSVASGERSDLSGQKAAELLAAAGLAADRSEVVADNHESIAALLRRLCDREKVALVVTTGGTGFSSRDVTPEATGEVIERRADGLAELMRHNSFGHTPTAALSRGVCGIRDRTLIINLPGSPKGVEENLTAVLPVLTHALDILAGEKPH